MSLNRTRENKMSSWSDAAALVKDGDTLALGGMTLYRRPVGFVQALLRREPMPRQLTLLCFTAGYESDLLVGAGCVSKVRSCYFGLEIFGFAPNYTQAAQNGQIEIIEESEASLAIGIRATMHGIGSGLSSAWQGTDMFRIRPDVRIIADPYSGEMLTAFPAIRCDVAVIHALVADRAGNARLNANWGVDRELALIANTLIITAETVVDQLDAQDGDIHIVAPLVKAVVEAPRGAWPTSCYPLYPLGGGELMRYVDDCNAGNFASYLSSFVNASS